MKRGLCALATALLLGLCAPGVAQETLDALMQQVQQAVPGCEVFITQAGCTVSSHCGPGTLGVLFLHRA